jgi:hypothetical protein
MRWLPRSVPSGNFLQDRKLRSSNLARQRNLLAKKCKLGGPVSQENGELFAAGGAEKGGISGVNAAGDERISRHQGLIAGELIAPQGEDGPEELDELVTQAIRRAKRGRPAAFDEHAKGKLLAPLALGLSLRQAASLLGVHHSTITNTLKADPALAEEITAARFQAQVQPLACIVRESRRSWKAATWLLKYLDGKIAGHEETPDEQRERAHREREEDQLRREERDAAYAAREAECRKQREAENLARRQAEVEALFPRRKHKVRSQVPGAGPRPGNEVK